MELYLFWTQFIKHQVFAHFIFLVGHSLEYDWSFDALYTPEPWTWIANSLYPSWSEFFSSSLEQSLSDLNIKAYNFPCIYDIEKYDLIINR